MTTARSESLQVFIRVRPPIHKEVKQEISVNVPNSTSVSINSEKGQTSCHYDHVFDEISEQEQVFEKVKPLLMDVLNGVNACIFAYGQTSAGKSFTMIGPNGGQDVFSRIREDWGILPRAAEYLLGYLNDKSDEGELTFQVKASFLQIYNENLYDLLRDTGPAIEERMLPVEKEQQTELKIREIPKRRTKSSSVPTTNAGLHDVFISGLSEFRVQTGDDIMRILHVGTKNRMTRSTDFNATSSRSHALLQLTFEIESNTSTGQTVINKSKLNLIDLAGSEKIPFVTSDYNNPKHMKELTAINKSLSSLGNVISALASKDRSHIPYRDSKLTRILQDSLGGNTRTILIACVAPTVHYVSETLSTLQFADRAKNVMLTVKANVLVDDKFLLAKAHSEITRLKTLLAHALKQVEQLKATANGGSVENTGSDDGQLNQLAEENAALKRENQQLKKAMKIQDNSTHGTPVHSNGNNGMTAAGQLLDTRLLVPNNGRPRPLPKYGEVLTSPGEGKKKKKKKNIRNQRHSIEHDGPAVFELLDSDHEYNKHVPVGGKQYKAINDRKIEELNSMLSRANHQMEQTQTQYQSMQQYLMMQQQQMQQFFANQQSMQQQYVVGKPRMIPPGGEQSYSYQPQQQPNILPIIPAGANQNRSSAPSPIPVLNNNSEPHRRPLPPPSPEDHYKYHPQTLPDIQPLTPVKQTSEGKKDNNAPPIKRTSAPSIISPESDPLSTSDDILKTFPNLGSRGDDNRSMQPQVAVPFHPPKDSVIPSTAGSDISVVSSQNDVPRNRIVRKATHGKSMNKLRKHDTEKSIDSEYADDDFEDTPDEEEEAVVVHETRMNSNNTAQSASRNQESPRRSFEINQNSDRKASASSNNHTRKSADSKAAPQHNDTSPIRRSMGDKLIIHMMDAADPSENNKANDVSSLLPAATAAPLPMHKPASLLHSKEDIGDAVQLFSFRMNSWEHIEIIDYEPNKRLHKCRHPDGSVQWLDLKKKPIRALPE